VALFVTYEPIDLDRLPWKTWEIAREFAVGLEIRITRSPTNLPYLARNHPGQSHCRHQLPSIQ
jgi:hypothetical protein